MAAGMKDLGARALCLRMAMSYEDLAQLSADSLPPQLTGNAAEILEVSEREVEATHKATNEQSADHAAIARHRRH